MLEFSKLKTWSILSVIILGVIYSLPNFINPTYLEGLPAWAPKQKVNLGLDLQGGSHILLAVEMDAVYKEQLESVQDTVRQTLRKNDINYDNLIIEGDAVTFKLMNLDDKAKALNELKPKDLGADVTIDDQGMAKLSLTEESKTERREFALEQSQEVIRRRVDELGTREPSIQRQGDDRVLVQLPGVDDPEHIKQLLGKTAKMTFHMVDDDYAASGKRSPGTKLLDSKEGGKVAIQKRALISGDVLTDARGRISQDGRWVVDFRFNSIGAKKFSDITSKSIGKRFAIVLDDVILSAPRINGHIPGGAGYIEGNFTAESANDLAVLMRAGALPAPMKVVEERSVGPGMGADSIKAGEMACVIGFFFVVLLMASYYGKYGMVANIALVANLIILLALLSITGSTLTLPGIAGIVLTMGMAVDANVVIFERIYEELRGGRRPYEAIEAGYDRAFTSIVDSNLTTFIAAAILFFLGTGPVKGFAVTLTFGLITSMFTAILLTRLIIAKFMVTRKTSSIKIHLYKLVPNEINWPFMSLRYVFYGLTILLTVGSVALVATKGLTYGVDFKGGIMMEVRMDKPADLNEMRTKLNALDLGEVSLQEFGKDTDVLIRIEKQEGGDEAQAAALNKIKESIGTTADFRRVEVVGPQVGKELIKSGIIGVLLALLGIMIYVWVRFDWQFGLCAVIALIHDVVSTVGLFSLTGAEFNLTVVAALLTILGYSINDTVIIYDRVRENLRKYRTMDLRQLLNVSINETLSRTIMTSGTTFVAVLALYLFGGSVISGFSLAMLWGVIVGTYSSICVSVPLLLFLNVNRKMGEETQEEDYDGARV